MENNIKTFSLIFAVAICSFSAAYFFPTKLQGLYAAPGVAALFAALFQIIRDNNAHIRQLEVQQKQQIFNIGATSHMANVAFDKHVEFCEKYMKEVHKPHQSYLATALQKKRSIMHQIWLS